MRKFYTKVSELLEKGFATEEEKEEVESLYKELDEDEQDKVEEDLEDVNDLPEEEEEDEDIDKSFENSIEKLIKTKSKEAKNEVAKELKADIKDYIEKTKDSMEKKSGIYNEKVQDKDRKQLNKKFKKTVAALYRNDLESLKEVGGFGSIKDMTTDATGTPFAGYAVDSELSAEIRHLTTDYGVARREMSTLTLSKNSLDANNLATDVTVYWVDEGAKVKSTEAVLGQESLDLKKLGAIVTLTSELIEDQEVDLFDFVASRVAEGFAQAEDEAFFDGDGSASNGSFTGILRAGGVNTVTLASGDTAFSDINADKLLDMQDATPQGAHPNGKYYMNRTILSYVRKLKDNDGNYIYQNPGGDQPATIWNKPVVLVEAMPDKNASAADKGFVIFGDLRRGCILGNKGTISAKRFDAGTVRNTADDGDINLITTDREAVRWTTRVGYIRIIPTAMTVLKTNAS